MLLKNRYIGCFPIHTPLLFNKKIQFLRAAEKHVSFQPVKIKDCNDIKI